MAAYRGWHIHQLDINNAFLHGSLNEEVYMTIPLGFQAEKPRQVCRLLRSMYGLKQASRQWNTRLSDALMSKGFEQSKSDPSLFIKELKCFLDTTFKIKDLGSLGYFLGIEAHISNDGLNLYQRKYALDILNEEGFLSCKPASTPMVPGHQLQKEGGTLLQDSSSYRRLVGRLLYLTATRPDITYAVQQLSQFVDTPTNEHLVAAHRVLRYIKKAPGQGIFYPRNGAMQLNVFSDSDWASCPETRRSVTGFCIFLGTAPVSWRTKKQATVSRSSSEAEYRALAATVCEVQWIITLLHDLQIEMIRPAAIFCDNKSAIAIGENHVFHERTKHIEIDCHIVREKVSQGLVKLLSVSSCGQVADGFTKALPTSLFQLFLSKLGTQDLHAPTYGGVGGGGNKE
ncbi:PREDICTED: uncharacterized protein LOC109184335 [Ipomoea nil]|uniref:uncharacterized protein LOC109184335 n=1 Tax=Ipomoea nil TaxID=35883 RepID=UPI00090127E7|nr:PREDICTED: uncharacterized protein LOC109184335 [Ipomoea nil]